MLFENFCGWCAHRHVGTDFVDSDEEDVGRTAHYAAPTPHSAEPAQAPCDSDGGGSPPERLALRAALDEDILAQRYHAGIPPEIPLGGGITLDHDILALPLDHNILMTMTLSELLQLAETVELGEEAVLPRAEDYGPCARR